MIETGMRKRMCYPADHCYGKLGLNPLNKQTLNATALFTWGVEKESIHLPASVFHWETPPWSVNSLKYLNLHMHQCKIIPSCILQLSHIENAGSEREKHSVAVVRWVRCYQTAQMLSELPTYGLQPRGSETGHERYPHEYMLSRQVISHPLLLCPWDFPGKNTGAVCYFLLQGTLLPRDQTHIFCIAGRFCTTKPPGKPIQYSALCLLGARLCMLLNAKCFLHIIQLTSIPIQWAE